VRAVAQPDFPLLSVSANLPGKALAPIVVQTLENYVPNLSKLLLRSLILVVINPIAWAGIGFQPVLPDELKMTSDPQAPGAPAIILCRQMDRDDNGRTSHEDHYYRIKILTEAGRKYADVEIPFFQDFENIVNIHARTIRPDGLIVDFDGKIFDKVLHKAKGVKYRAKTFALPDVQVG